MFSVWININEQALVARTPRGRLSIVREGGESRRRLPIPPRHVKNK